MPKRVQHKRGQHKPPNTVLVKRPYRFGNPFDWRVHGPEKAVQLHAEWIINPDSKPIRCGNLTYRPSTAEEIRERLCGNEMLDADAAGILQARRRLAAANFAAVAAESGSGYRRTCNW
jgi:hypothetical protein